jgi:hypothetical protein
LWLFGVCQEQPERAVGAEWSHRAEVPFVRGRPFRGAAARDATSTSASM